MNFKINGGLITGSSIVYLTNFTYTKGWEFVNYLHLVPRSRMRGAMPPCLQYVSMTWCLV